MPRAGETKREWDISNLEWDMLKGCDIGFICSDINEHPNGDDWDGAKHRRGKSGFDKTLSLTKMQDLADEVNANIIVKNGNGKWYIKRLQDTSDYSIQQLTEKQAWRGERLKRCILYVKR